MISELICFSHLTLHLGGNIMLRLAESPYVGALLKFSACVFANIKFKNVRITNGEMDARKGHTASFCIISLYMVVSRLGLTRGREPWIFWKAWVLELDEVNSSKVLAMLRWTF